jgi:hypothetical protein
MSALDHLKRLQREQYNLQETHDMMFEKLRHGSNELDSVSARQPTSPRISGRSSALSQAWADSLKRLTSHWPP